MSSIDNRVVNMQFNNQQFEQGIKTTLASLEALNKGLKLEGASKGLEDLSKASKHVNLSHIEAGVQSIVDKFRTMSIVGITALTTLAHQAIIAGQTLVSSLTIDPIKTGLNEYETNLNSIQTILSNTQWQKTGLNDVNAALQELNEYSDQTIYNFSEMARNIGTFTAAGVKLEVATEAIKGIANLAAISGSNSQQAATAMYQLSQALAAGKVSLMDWNSVVNAGMGGKVFQDALMETARIHGVAIDKMVKDAGSFRNTLEKGWLTSDILTETLSKFTGDLNAAQLKSMGYNDQQIAGILKMGQTAQDAATKVKTFSALINTLQESATSGWAQTWQLIFGDFEEARDLFTNASDVFGGFIKSSAEARNSVISDWKELGGRTVLIEAITHAFNALMEVVTPIRKAFRDIFPATTGKQLYDITVAVRDFFISLRMGEDTMDNIRRTFAGFFAIIGIGWDILKEGIGLFFRLFGAATEGSGGFLEATASVGDFFVELRKALQEGQGIVKFFDKLGDILEPPIRLLGQLGSLIGSLFGGFDGAEAVEDLTGLVGKLEPLGRLGEIIASVWSRVLGILDNVWDIFSPLADRFVSFFKDLGSSISEAVGGIDFQDVLGGINTGLFAGLLLMLRNLIGGGGAGGILSGVRNTIEGLTDTLGAMQNTLRAATLLQIAAAIGILTLSVSALSKIDSEGLTRALTAMAVMFTQLFTAMAVLEKFLSIEDIAEIYAIVGALTLLGVAIRILTSSVKALAELDWNELGKGLTGVTVLLGAMIATAKLMPNPAGLISTGAGMIVLAVGIKILASAVTDLSSLSWEEMAKGLTSVGALLGGLILFTKFAQANAGGLIQGAGIILLATGIKILASALEDLGEMSWEEIGKGLAATAGGLVLIGLALNLIPPTALLSAAGVLVVAASLGMIADALGDMGDMSWSEIGKGLTTLAGALTLIGLAISLIPPTAPISAAGILIVAAALGMIGDALKKMGGMSWGEIAKGLVTLAGALTIIAVAMAFMTTALPGAAALLVVAGALTILTPILQTFGQMSWEEMGKGLLMLAGVFVVLGAAGLVLTPLVPTLLGLGIAITLLGAGMLLAGAGVLAFSIALTALSVSGAAGAAAIVAIVSSLVGLIPMVMTQIGLGIVAFAKVIATAGPAITEAITVVLLALITAIATLTPKIVETLFKLLVLLLDEMKKAVPRMVRAGYEMLIGILEGIRDNITKTTSTALEVIAKFIDGIAKGLPKVIQSGVNLIITFVESLAKAIDQNSERMGKAGGELATAIIKGMVKGLFAGSREIANAAKSVAKNALEAAKDILGISSPSKEFFEVGKDSDEGLAGGLHRYSTLVAKAAEDVGTDAMHSLKNVLAEMSDAIKADVDMNPTITPVLDLTDVQKQANLVGRILETRPLSVTATYDQARSASTEYQTHQTASDDRDDRGGDTIYNQYNNSPKALSSAEIYRQTKNQLSATKGELP